MLDECPICLEECDISNNVIIKLDCCKKDVHIDCIKQWIMSIDNKNKKICLLCRKNSEIINDLYNNLNINSIIDNSNSTIHYIQINEPYEINNIIRNPHNKNIITYIVFIYLVIEIIIIILLDNI